MLHQVQEPSKTAEFDANLSYSDHAKQLVKGGALLFGLGTLGALGYRFLGWLSSNLHGAPLDDNPVKAQTDFQQHASVEELDANGNPVFQGVVTYSPETIHQASAVYSADRAVANPLTTTTVLSSYQANKILSTRTAMPTVGAFVTDLKSVATNELDADDDLTLEYRENRDKISREDCETNIVSTKDESVSRINCLNAMVFGLMGSLITRNPFYLGAASLLCTQRAYGQIVDNQIPNQLANIGDRFELDLNISDLFDGPAIDVRIIQSDGSALPDWLRSEPILVGSLVMPSIGITVSGNFAYVSCGNEGIKIVDVSNPTNPTLKGSLATINAQKTAVSGSLLYLADGEGGLKIIDVSNATHPILMGNITTYNALGVAINGNFSYVADYIAGLKIIDVSDATNPFLTGSLSIGDSEEDIVVNNNYAYLADSIKGLTIVDISNATNPVLIVTGFFSGAHGIAISGNFSYVANDISGLRIIDVSNIAHPILKKTVASVVSAKKVVIDRSIAYVADGNGGLKIIDVNNSTGPIEIGSYTVSLANVFGVAVSNNFVYVADTSKGLKIIDLSSYWTLYGTPTTSKQQYYLRICAKNNLLQTVQKKVSITTDYFPKAIGSISDHFVMPQKTLTLDLNVDYFFQDSDTDENLGLGIQFDGNNICPEFVQFNIKPYMVGKIATTYAGSVVIKENLAYVADWTTLKIIDFTDSKKLVLKGLIPMSNIKDVVIDGDLAYAADSESGLKIVNVSDATKPVLKGVIKTYSARGVAFSGSLVYVADNKEGLKIIDVSNATHPILMGNITTFNAASVLVSGNIAYVADNKEGLKIIDVSNATHPILMGNITTFNARRMKLRSNQVYLADGNGLKIIDVSNPAAPVLKGSIFTFSAVGVTVSGNLAYVADYSDGLKIIDIANISKPILRGTAPAQAAYDIAVRGDQAYLADHLDFRVIDGNRPRNDALVVAA